MKRKLTLVLTALLGLALLGVLTLRVALKPERLRALVLDTVSAATGLEVSVESARLSLLPFGVSFAGLRVAAHPAEDPPALALESGLVRMRVLPILRRALVVDVIELTRPRIALRQESGEVVLPGNLGEAAARPSRARAKPSSSFGFEGQIRAYSIEGGSVEIASSPSAEQLSVQGIDLRGSLDAHADGRVTSTGELSLKQLSLAALEPFQETLRELEPVVHFEVEYDPSAERLELKSVRLSAPPLELGFRGDVRGIQDAPVLALELERQTVELADFVPLLPSSALGPGPPPEAGGALTVAASYTAALAEPETPPEISMDLELRGARWTQEGLAAPVTDLRGDVRIRDGTASLEGISGSFGRSRFRARGEITNVLQSPRLSIEGECPLLDLSELAPPVGEPGRGAARGTARGTPPEEPPLVPPLPPFDVDFTLTADSLITTTGAMSRAVLTGTIRNAQADVQVRIAGADFDGVVLDEVTGAATIAGQTVRGNFRSPRVQAHRVPLTDVTGKINLGENRILRIENVIGQLWNGRVEGLAEVDLTRPGDPGFRIDAKAAKVDANALLSTLTPARDVFFGTLDLSSTFSGSGTTPELIAEKLSGNGTFGAKEGRLEKSPAISSMWNALNLGEERAIPFRDLATKFSVENGRLITPDVVIQGANANWKGSGAIAFDGRLDYDVQVELSESLSERYRKRAGRDLAKLLANTDGRLVIDLKVTGPASRPEVKPDLEKLVKRATKNVREELKESGKKILENLFGGAAAADSSDSTQADDPLGDLFKNLVGKKP